jgi:hypothetical protein
MLSVCVFAFSMRELVFGKPEGAAVPITLPLCRLNRSEHNDGKWLRRDGKSMERLKLQLGLGRGICDVTSQSLHQTPCGVVANSTSENHDYGASHGADGEYRCSFTPFLQ